MKRITGLFISIWLVGCVQLWGQSTGAEEIPLSTHESTLIGIGGYNLRDTYLSPSTNINYTGWVARVLNERMKMVRAYASARSQERTEQMRLLAKQLHPQKQEGIPATIQR